MNKTTVDALAWIVGAFLVGLALGYLLAAFLDWWRLKLARTKMSDVLIESKVLTELEEEEKEGRAASSHVDFVPTMPMDRRATPRTSGDRRKGQQRRRGSVVLSLLCILAGFVLAMGYAAWMNGFHP